MIYCALGILNKESSLENTFFLLDADAEERHKQWLSLGLISVLVSKAQSSKIIPADLALRSNSSVFEIKLNVLHSLDQIYIEWENLS